MGISKKRLRTFRNICLALIALLGIVVASLLMYRSGLQSKIAERRAITNENGIEITEKVRIGGIDQYINIVEGSKVSNDNIWDDIGNWKTVKDSNVK